MSKHQKNETTATTTTGPTTKTIDDLAAGDVDNPERHDLDAMLIARAIVELRALVESSRKETARDVSALKLEVARLKESNQANCSRVDAFAEMWAKHRGEMDQSRRDAGEQLKIACKVGRDIDEKLKAFKERWDTTPDPAVIVAPIRRALAQLTDDLKALDRSVDIRFEQVPGINRKRPLETRGEGPSARPGFEPEKKQR